MARQLPPPSPLTLKALRHHRNLTQEEVAAAAKISVRRYQQLEEGAAKGGCFASSIDGIAKVLDVTRDRLYQQMGLVGRARLPTTGKDLFGRESILRRLHGMYRKWIGSSALQLPNIVCVVGFGGVGKSAIVNEWLHQIELSDKPPQSGFCWSFYRQSTQDGFTSSDEFFEAALAHYSDRDSDKSRFRAERLAKLVSDARSLLILDGVEMLQQPPGPRGGYIHDTEFRTFLLEVVAAHRGLCVITTRYPIADFESVPEKTVAVISDIDRLPQRAGIKLLRSLSVVGSNEDLVTACEAFGYHALSLTLLGTYLRDAFQPKGDIAQLVRLKLLEEDQATRGHAERIMSWYEEWLVDKPELSILLLLSLFDGPATSTQVEVLRAARIEGLTRQLSELTPEQWTRAVSSLRRARLISSPHTEMDDCLDTHMLVREYFSNRLQEGAPVAWKQGNETLFNYLSSTPTIRHLPSSVVQLAPLFAAVAYGCRAGLHEQAFCDVYRPRILRGDEYYSWKVLGAFRAGQAALAEFFDRPWDRPVASLSSSTKGEVLNEAGLHLRAIGRPELALKPWQRSLELMLEQGMWESATVDAGNISELLVLLGRISQAIEYATRSIPLAKRTKDPKWMMISRTYLADALVQAGSNHRAKHWFQAAERYQQRREPERPLLYSVQGYQYGDLLLDDIDPTSGLLGIDLGLGSCKGSGRIRNVRQRTQQILHWDKQRGWPLDIASGHLVHGRAVLTEHILLRRRITKEIEKHFDVAIQYARAADEQEFIAKCLLAKGAMLGRAKRHSEAEVQIQEAESIARSGRMRLQWVDCLIAKAGHGLALGHYKIARKNLSLAAKEHHACEYGRRAVVIDQLSRHLVATS